MLPYKRSERVAELLRERICQALLEIGVPASAGIITITGVKVTEDLLEAFIFYSVLGSDQQKKEAERFFQVNLGNIRYLTGQGLMLRKVPVLRFSLDETIERAARIFSILEKIDEPRKTAPKARKRRVKKRKTKSAG